MALRNTPMAWGSGAKLLHWLLALLIVGMLIVGFVATGVYGLRSEQGFALIQQHKSFGILVLALAALRLGWRWSGPTPGLPAHTKPYERFLAQTAHYGLYALMFAMPLSGWLLVSTSSSSIKTQIFGLFNLPALIGPNHDAHELFEEAHELMAYVLIALIVLHVLGALKHHLIYRDNVLRRMMPFSKPN